MENLSQLNHNGNWQLPPPLSENMLELHIHLTMVTLTQENDSYEWVIDSNTHKKYNNSQV